MRPAVTEAIAARLLESFGLNWRPAWERELPAALRALAARRSVPAERLGAAMARGEASLVELAPFLTVGETHFLRIPEQFEAIARHAARALDQPGASYAVWSAGCSSGEEPLSVALTLHRALGPVALARADLAATDLSAEALDKARAGVYTPWSFRGVSESLRDAYFRRTEDGRFRANPELVRAVRYRQSDLLAQASTLARASLDVVLFRNVGIYLSAPHLERLFRELARALKPTGLLLVAPSDPRPPASLFTPARADGCAIYEWGRAPGVQRAPLGAPRLASASKGRASKERQPARRGRRFTPNGRRLTAPARPSQPPASAPPVADATAPVAHGPVAHALAAPGQVAPDQLDPDLASMEEAEQALRAGDTERAVTTLRRVLYHRPGDLPARLVLSAALEEAGRHDLARHQRRNVRQALAALGDDERVGADGVTAGELRQALGAEEEVA